MNAWHAFAVTITLLAGWCQVLGALLVDRSTDFAMFTNSDLGEVRLCV